LPFSNASMFITIFWLYRTTVTPASLAIFRLFGPAGLAAGSSGRDAEAEGGAILVDGLPRRLAQIGR
jgi:hypothetical protein